MYTTKTGSKVLGIKQDSLKRYAIRNNYGVQPGGPKTPRLFLLEDLLEVRDRWKPFSYKWERVEAAEDRVELELGPMYNPDGSPRK